LVIVGGGASGWLAALHFARFLGEPLEITVVATNVPAT
jgi:NADH dehydrogenase FAD-containing subunit